MYKANVRNFIELVFLIVSFLGMIATAYFGCD